MNTPLFVLMGALGLLTLATSASADWTFRGDGDWTLEPSTPLLLWQRAPIGAADAVAQGEGEGYCFRTLVELAPGRGEAGIWFGASEDLQQGFRLTLGAGGLVLRDAAGQGLWEDAFAPWTCYTPYALEGIAEPGRVRVQMLNWDHKTLVSQSDWIEVETAPQGRLGLHTRNSIARFYRWEQAVEPLSPIVPDAPNKLRLRHGEGTDWVVVGPGYWMWTTAERKALRQAAEIERSSALCRTLGGAEGVWRCRVKVLPGAGGAGMLFQANEGLDQGFIAWLGGNWGAGGLMLYRLPVEALWSSPQDTWHYDTEYVLEASIQGGKASVRLLAADGEAVLAASPAFDLKPEEIGRAGLLGFQTWIGRAEFWDFSEQTHVAAGEGPAASPLGPEWQVVDGDWAWAGEAAIRQRGTGEVATALNPGLRAARARWRCRVTPGEGAQAVGLLFQVDPALKEGFLLRLAEGAQLRSLDGRLLWREPDARWQAGREYLLEGFVDTDRVQVRVTDAATGEVVAESVAVYVSDRNNDRIGVLGLRTEGGPAEFRGWEVQ